MIYKMVNILVIMLSLIQAKVFYLANTKEKYKAITMVYRKSMPSENIYFIENHLVKGIFFSKGRCGKDYFYFFHK